MVLTLSTRAVAAPGAKTATGSATATTADNDRRRSWARFMGHPVGYSTYDGR
jgi:hypothetical protein